MLSREALLHASIEVLRALLKRSELNADIAVYHNTYIKLGVAYYWPSHI